MTTKFSLYSVLLGLLLPLNGYPLYDQLAIDLKPTENELQFCFTPGYSNPKWQVYLAALINNQLYFVDTQNQPAPWDGVQEPPFFIKKEQGVKTTCFPPLSKTLLTGIPVYVGIGNDFADIATNSRYTRIFDGTFPTLPQPSRLWTVMVYIIGSTLESIPQHLASQDLIEMLNGSQQMVSDNVNLVLTTGGSTREGWKTVKRSLIHQGQQQVLADLGEQNMAAPETLSEFVPWAVTHFPASHYALILWDHGHGALGYGSDASKAGLAANQGKPDEMTLTELHQAFQTIRPQLANPLDIISYDACNMATIEVAEVTATLANAMSASVEKEPDHGADYNYLLTHLATHPPANGLEFGKLLKTSYLQQTQQKLSATSEQTTWDTDQITYSVLDLTQLPTFWNTFKDFAIQLDDVLRNTDFLNADSSYKMLSYGMIHAPIYPAVLRVNTIRSKRFSQAINEKDVHIDLYAVLQTVLPNFSELKSVADNLLTQLNQLVIEYEANPNVKKIHSDAGRLSINIGTGLPYLKELPEAYQLFYEALAYYNTRKANDLSNINDDSKKTCYGHTTEGMVCAAFPNWLRLPASEVLEVEAYLGQYTAGTDHIYLMKTLYQSQGEVTEEMELGIDGNQACDYQVCVNDTDCASITLTEQNDRRFADIILNDNPAVLTFCQGEDKQWQACSVISQTDGFWGRSSVLYPDDMIAPTTLQWSDGEETLEEITGKTLTVAARPVTLKQHCDPTKAVIITSSYGANLQPAYRELCRDASCVCTAEDLTTEPGDDACKKVGTKAGVIIEP